MKKIIVLMSTYNGEKYLREQIDTIIGQQGVEVDLLVRDDGSTDSTIAILDEYESKGLLTWYTGENLRPAKSFLNLLSNAPECEYYAFADQDDIWKPNKLSTAIKKLEQAKEYAITNTGGRMLYFCNKNIVDSNDQLLSFTHYHFLQSTARAFLECFASGCCMVFNNELRFFVNQNPPSTAILHDHWIFILANIFGMVIFDDTPFMDYRQHSNNVVGAAQESYFQKIGHLFKRRNDIVRASDIAKDVLNINESLSSCDLQNLKLLANSNTSIMARLKMTLSDDFSIAQPDIKKRMYNKLKIFLNRI